MTEIKTDHGETATLCRFVSETTYRDISAEAISHAKRMILDTVGVTLAAIDTEVVDTIELPRLCGGKHVRVPGTGEAGRPFDVAFTTGVAAHALAFDDVHHDMGGHPSSPVFSALLPIAQQEGASGRQFLRSFVLGTEAEIRLANVLNPGLYERGWHPTAVLGVLGAAVAVSDLLELNLSERRRAIGIAASRASGTKENFGTMTKPLHVGDAARNGLEAARLAAKGVTASESVLDAPFGGFCDLYQGKPSYDFAEHFETLGSPWGLRDPPVGFKPYPCCGSTHAVIDAALAIKERYDVSPSEIGEITIRQHPKRLGHSNRPSPETPLDAKLSAQYIACVALHDGDVWLDHFTETAVNSERYRSSLPAVEICEDRQGFAAREWGARVEVETRGDRYVVERDAPTGSAESPMTQDQLERKYRRCAGRAIPDESVERSLQLLTSLEELDDVSSMLDPLT